MAFAHAASAACAACSDPNDSNCEVYPPSANQGSYTGTWTKTGSCAVDFCVVTGTVTAGGQSYTSGNGTTGASQVDGSYDNWSQIRVKKCSGGGTTTTSTSSPSTSSSGPTTTSTTVSTSTPAPGSSGASAAGATAAVGALLLAMAA